MRTAAEIDSKQVNEMDLTISVTMTVDEWRKIMRDLSNVYPAGKLARHISGVIGHVTKMSSATVTEGAEA